MSLLPVYQVSTVVEYTVIVDHSAVKKQDFYMFRFVNNVNNMENSD